MNTEWKLKTVLGVGATLVVAALFFVPGVYDLFSTGTAAVSNSSLMATGVDDEKVSRLGTIDVPPEAFSKNPSGLKTSDVILGEGSEVQNNKSVVIHYVGRFLDGTQFDSSVERKEPLVFMIGQRQVISGLERGIEGMRVGGVRRIIVPSDLAYGISGIKDNTGAYIIPPQTALMFDVLLLGVGR